LLFYFQQAQAEEQRLKSRYDNNIEIAKAKRDFELKQAAYDQEVNAKKATADLAYQLQVKLFFGVYKNINTGLSNSFVTQITVLPV
jgi:hypothetical protein